MTKSILISVRPENVVNILNGKKTLELRKSFPKDFIGWVYVYVTKSKPYLSEVVIDEYFNTDYELFNIPHFGDVDLNGKVVARFWFDEYEKISLELIDKSGYDEDRLKEYESEKMTNEELLKKLCLSDVDIDNYLNSYDGYAWHIKELEIFDEPLKLRDFALFSNYKDKVEKMTPYERSILIFGNTLEKSPQSWCYVYTNKGEMK